MYVCMYILPVFPLVGRIFSRLSESELLTEINNVTEFPVFCGVLKIHRLPPTQRFFVQ